MGNWKWEMGGGEGTWYTVKRAAVMAINGSNLTCNIMAPGISNKAYIRGTVTLTLIYSISGHDFQNLQENFYQCSTKVCNGIC